MTKRLLDWQRTDYLDVPGAQAKQAIIASEGRVIMAETVSSFPAMYGGTSGAQVDASFGAQLILLNTFDVFHPEIKGLPTASAESPVAALKAKVGALVGINLEPVDETVQTFDEQFTIAKGRQATSETFAAAEALGIDYVLLTGNPKTQVTNQKISAAIKGAKQAFYGLIFAGKMHSSGVDEPVITAADVQEFINAGADGILLPAPYTVPGYSPEILAPLLKIIADWNARPEVHHDYQQRVVTIAANGTSQDSADLATIRQIGLASKALGFDVQHVGDSLGGLADPEAIYALGVAIRGKRHQVQIMARH